MNLRHLTDIQILKEIKILVQDERRLSVKILHHMREIDHRRLYSDIGYQSLFDYAVRHLGYSASAAYRRIQAARMLNDVPEIEGKINSGALNLTHITDAAGFFRENNVKDSALKKEVLGKIEALSKKETSVKLRELSGKVAKRMIPVPLSEETLEKVEHWRGLRPEKKSSDELIFGALEVAISQAGKVRFHETKMKQKIYQRDEKKCTNCGSTHNLQYDHRQPKALGGEDVEENLRLLCFACNQRARIRAGL